MANHEGGCRICRMSGSHCDLQSGPGNNHEAEFGCDRGGHSAFRDSDPFFNGVTSQRCSVAGAHYPCRWFLDHTDAPRGPGNGGRTLVDGRAMGGPRCVGHLRRRGFDGCARAASPARCMKETLHAEWTKFRTVTSSAWLLAAAVVITAIVGAATTGSLDISRCPTPRPCPEDTTKLALTGVWFGQVAVVVLAGLMMTNEYSTKMIHSTLLATPRRFRVLAAKAGVIAVTVGVAGSLAGLASLVVARFVLHGDGFTPENGYQALTLADEPTLRAAVGTVLYLALVALLTLGIATVVRDTAGIIPPG